MIAFATFTMVTLMFIPFAFEHSKMVVDFVKSKF